MCGKLDEIDRKVNSVENSFLGKADRNEVNQQFANVLQRLDDAEANFGLLSDNQTSQKAESEKKMKELEDKVEANVGKCFIDCRNLTKDLVRECEPEIAKNVISSLPNLEKLLDENKEMKDQIEILKKRVDDLDGGRGISSEDLEKLRNSMPSSLSISDSDLKAISDDINGRMNAELAKLRDLLKQYTDDQINNVFGRSDEQGKNLAIDIANAVKLANAAKDKAEYVANDVDKKFDKTNENINNVLTESNKAQSQLNNKISDLTIENDQLKEKMEDMQKLMEGLNQKLDDQSMNAQELQSMVMKDDGQIDLSPILKQLNAYEAKIAVHNERINILENKDTVHPLAVSNLRDKIDILDQQLQNLTAKLGKFEADQFTANDRIRDTENRLTKHDKEIEELKTDSEKAKAAIESIRNSLEAIQNRVNEFKEKVDEFDNKVNEVIAQQAASNAARKTLPAKDGRVDNLIELIRRQDKELTTAKEKLAAVCATIEQMSSRLGVLGNLKDHSSDLNEIRSEMQQLWDKIKELTELQADNNNDFLPKVDLSRPVQRPATVIERTVLPRIAYPKSPRVGDDQRVSDTAMKVEKQEGLLYQLKRAVDQHQKSIAALDENKADKQAAQLLFEQFRIALGELNNRLGTLKRAIIGKVDAADLNNYLNQVMGNYNDDETAMGTEPIRCLCCGKPRKSITGALDDPTLAKRLGGPVSTRVLGDGDGQVCFVYGERGDMYYGRSGTGKSVFSKPPEATV
ncbi:hypothetical protein TRFO_37867 [Tritrichomonas foetus]|uniref:Uncharacterized protein n=1 Tax=Tritrichomonas foetus TaxID=1144522 RepID=A0A1J4JEV2_9EUKA|nr:hypothetical protein TRFO_37867 [Tritrichomonas foetus]|eukprot:OHS95973.1 hypothetical protein TRFO_37867 [Tritrichomonas foetus]